MKKCARLTAAALAVVSAMTFAAVTAGADRLKNVDGVRWLCSDDGTVKGKFTGFAKDKEGNRYYCKDGKIVRSRWLRVKGERTYYALENGRLAVGDVKTGGKEYTFGTDGKVFPEDFGIQMSLRVTKELLSLSLVTDQQTRLRSFGCELDRDEAPVIERKTSKGWEKLSGVVFDGKADWMNNEKYHFDRLWLNGMSKAEYGDYRVTKTVTAKSPMLVGGSKTFTIVKEFKITDKTEHAFFDPPELMIYVGGERFDAVKGTYSWCNEYADDAEFGQEVESDAEGALDSVSEQNSFSMPYGTGVRLKFSFGEKPKKVGIKRWDEKYKGDYDAYEKYESVDTTNGLSFIPELGGNIYEIHASWDRFDTRDVTMCGNCYYTVYIKTWEPKITDN